MTSVETIIQDGVIDVVFLPGDVVICNFPNKGHEPDVRLNLILEIDDGRALIAYCQADRPDRRRMRVIPIVGYGFPRPSLIDPGRVAWVRPNERTVKVGRVPEAVVEEARRRCRDLLVRRAMNGDD